MNHNEKIRRPEPAIPITPHSRSPARGTTQETSRLSSKVNGSKTALPDSRKYTGWPGAGSPSRTCEGCVRPRKEGAVSSPYCVQRACSTRSWPTYTFEFGKIKWRLLCRAYDADTLRKWRTRNFALTEAPTASNTDGTRHCVPLIMRACPSVRAVVVISIQNHIVLSDVIKKKILTRNNERKVEINRSLKLHFYWLVGWGYFHPCDKKNKTICTFIKKNCSIFFYLIN